LILLVAVGLAGFALVTVAANLLEPEPIERSSALPLTDELSGAIMLVIESVTCRVVPQRSVRVAVVVTDLFCSTVALFADRS